jgi:hypothetical protein
MLGAISRTYYFPLLLQSLDYVPNHFVPNILGEERFPIADKIAEI